MAVHHLSKKELRQVQLIQLELLEEVERICSKCGIHYNIIAGTLLGAVRHRGYIPWDDDADVAFLREEYEKFRTACETELDWDRFYFQDHRNTLGYRWGYGKLRRKGTLFLREHQEHMPYEQGIFIDIFPLDAVSDYKIIRSLQNFKYYCLRKVMWAPVGSIASSNHFLRGWYRALNRIPAGCIYGCYDRIVNRKRMKKTQWVRILTFPTPNREYGYRREWYEHSSRIEFEGQSFWGIEDYESYLTFKFGDYLELPPEEKRKVHPVTGLKCVENGSKNCQRSRCNDKIFG